MSDTISDELLNSLVELHTLDVKRTSPEGQAAAQQELANLNYYQVAANLGENRDPSTMGEIENILRSGDYEALKSRLGEDTAYKVRGQFLRAFEQVNADRNTPRDWGEVAQDAAVGVPASVANFLWSGEMLAGGVMDPEYMAVSAERNTEFNDKWVNPYLSDALKNRRQVKGAVDAQDEREHAAQEKLDVAAGMHPFDAATKRFFSDIGASAINAAQDPVVLSQGLVEAGASMGEAAVLGKGLRAIGQRVVAHQAAKVAERSAAKAMARGLTKEAAGNIGKQTGQRVVQGLARTTDALAWAGANAGLEGASAYQQAVMEVLSMDPKDLAETSADFRKRVAELKAQRVPDGEAQKQAQHWVANRVGMITTGVVAPAAGLLGHFIGKGGEHPLSVTRGFIREVLSEGLEEGSQGLVGGLAQNAAMKGYVNPEQDMLAGVGRQIGEGAALGALSAGAMKSPHMALHLTGKTGQLGLSAAKFAAQKGAEREAKNLAASPVESKALTESTAALLGEQDSHLATLSDAVDQMKVSDEERVQIKGALARRVLSLEVTQQPITMGVLPEAAQKVLEPLTNRTEAVQKTAELLLKEKDPQAQQDLALHLTELLKPMREHQVDPSFIEGLLTHTEAKQILDSYDRVLANAENTAVVRRALEKTKSIFGQATSENVLTEETLAALPQLSVESEPAAQEEQTNTVKEIPASLAEMDQEIAAAEQKPAPPAPAVNELDRRPYESADDWKFRVRVATETRTLDEVKAERATAVAANEALNQEPEMVKFASNWPHWVHMPEGREAHHRWLAAQNKVDDLNRFIKALEKARKPQPVPETQIQRAVRQEVARAMVDPGTGSAEKTALILKHSQEGRIKLSPSERAALSGSLALLRAKEAHETGKVSKALGKTIQAIHTKHLSRGLIPWKDLVSMDVTVNRKGSQKNDMPSALEFTRLITQAMAAGNEKLARAYLTDMGLFVQHFQNKVWAANKSHDDRGKKVAYRQLLPDRTWAMSDSNPYQKHTELFVNTHSTQSIELVQGVEAEAKFLHDVFSGLTEAFPQLKVKKPKLVELHANLRGDPTQVVAKVKAALAARKVAAQAEVQPTTALAPVPSLAPATNEVVEGKNTAKEVPASLQEKPKEEEQQKALEAPVAVEPTPTPEPVVETKTEGTKEEEVPAHSVAHVFKEVAKRATNMLVKAFRIRLKDEMPITRTLGMGRDSLPETRKALTNQAKLDEHLGKKSESAYGPEMAAEYQRLLESDPKVLRLLDQMEERLANLKQKEGESKEDFEARKTKVQEQVQNAGGLMAVIARNLQAFLNKDEQAAKNKFLSGEAAERWNQAKVLNITEVGEDNQVRYNPELLQQAVLAGLQWWLTMSQRESELHDSDIAAITGMELGEAPETLVNLLNQGMGTAEAVRSLAQVITRFWGLQAKKNADLAYTDGILGAVAAEVIRALLETGMVKEILVDVGQHLSPATNKVVSRFVAVKRDKGENALYSYPSVIEEAVVIEPEQLTFYGDDEIPMAQYQLGKSKVKLTKPQKTALKNLQAQGFTLDMPFVNWLRAVGQDELVRLFGTVVPEGTQSFNRNHKESLEGSNLNIIGAFQELTATINQMERRRGDTPLHELKKRYSYAVTSVDRMMMQGRYNPQSSKLMREAMMSTWSTLDLSKESSEHHQHFRLAVAQALGIKVHRKSLEVVLAELDTKLKDLAPAVELMKAHQQKNEGGFPAVQLREILDESEAPVTFVAVHALMELARLELAEDKSAFRTSLYLEADGMTNGPNNALWLLSVGEITERWVENVGKGGASFGSTPRTADTLVTEDLYETTKGHAEKFISGMLRQILGQEENGQRIHQHAQKLMDALSLLGMDLSVGEDKQGNLVITLDRGAAKSPMTVTVYGSGAQGLANQIGKELMDAFYAKLSDVIQAEEKGLEPWEGAFPNDPAAKLKYSQLMHTINAITGLEAGYSKGKQIHYIFDPHKDPERPTATMRLKRRNGFQNFTFSDKERATLQNNLKTLFVAPMRAGIEETLGPSVFQSRDLIRGATQLQSVVLRSLFLKAIQDKIAEKAADPEKFDYKPGDFLSERELDEIWEGLRKAGAVPEMVIDGQPFLVTKESVLELTGNKGDSFRPEFSRGLDDSLRNPANVFAPDNAGVSAIPKVVIGMGDGRMVREFYQEPKPGTLEVYDGMNMPIDQIKQLGEAVNQAALSATQGNIFQGVGKALDNFLASSEVISELQTNDELVWDLIDTLRVPVDEFVLLVGRVRAAHAAGGSTGGEKRLQKLIDEELKKARKKPEVAKDARRALEGYVHRLATGLDQNTLDMQARRMVFGNTAMSYDQMASAYAAFVQKGEDFAPGATAADIAAELETRRQKALDKLLEGNPVSARPRYTFIAPEAKPAPAPKPSSSPSLAPEAVGGRKHSSGVRVLGQTAIQKLVKTLELSSSEKAVVGEFLRSKALTGYQVVVGTPEQIQAYQASQGLSAKGILGKDGEVVHGAIDDQSRTIFLMSTQTETVVHELVHAATYATVLAHYEGEDLGPNATHIQEAITRLERLMGLFLQTSFPTEDDVELGAAVNDAAAAILKHQQNFELTPAEQKAAALNEFMAWSLANRALAEQLAETDLPDTAEGRLAKIAKSAYQAIKKLIWGKKQAPQFGTDVLSQIRFNTAIITRAQTTVGQVSRENTQQIALFHATQPNQVANGRLLQVRRAFNLKVADKLLDTEFKPEHKAQSMETSKVLFTASDLALQAQAHFSMSDEEAHTFKMIVATLATEAHIAPQSLNEANRLFAHLLRDLDPGDFVDPTIDRESAAFDDARKEFIPMVNFLTGKELLGVDTQGRTTLLPVFLGLALTSEQFRQVLAQKEVPQVLRKDGEGVNGFLESQGNKLMDQLAMRLTGTKNPANVKDALDQLGTYITKSVLEERDSLADKLSLARGTGKVNEYLVRSLHKIGNAAFAKGEELQQSDKLAARIVGVMLKGVSALAADEQNDLVAQGVVAAANKMELWTPAMEFLTQLVGRTANNADVYDMSKWVKAAVDRLRQSFRDVVPGVIRKKFTETLSPEQWDNLYQTMGRYDMASLADLGSTAEVMKLAADRTALKSEAARLEQEIREASPKQWKLIDKKINQLVNYTHTGECGPNLLGNAYAISRLFGERVSKKWENPSDEAVQAIDQLVTLRTLLSMDQAKHQAFAELVQKQPQGVEFVLDYLKGQRVTELAKATDGAAQVNHIKGHLPQEWNRQGHLMVAENSRFAELTAMGYKRVGTYQGSNIETGMASRSYYYAAQGSPVAFAQGIARNIDHTAYGVHRGTGYSTGLTAGLIIDPLTVQQLAKRMHLEQAGAENLRPIYNSIGIITAFERTVDPEQLKRLQPPHQDLAKMLGQWRGRQLEEEMAMKTNGIMVDNLHAMLTEDLAKSQDNIKQYVDVFGEDVDPVIRDAVNLLPPELVKQIRVKFGDKFYVRKDMVLDVLGTRNATVGDFWTGNTRWSEETQKYMRHTLTGIFGADAFSKLIKLERNLQAVVKTTKTNIVVRSAVVPAINITSNFLQLMGRGMGPLAVSKAMLAKTAEIHTYVNSFAKQVKLEAELRAAEGDILKEGRLKAEIQTIKDGHRRLSIWPLIEAGEFSTIADLGSAAEDHHLTSGNIMEYLSAKVESLPPGLRNAAKLGYLARDTALFQGLQKAVQYGDFIAKAALYDHYTQKKGMKSKEALGKITEEFINYDVLPGRGRGYLESIGVWWFLNYKLRSVKVGLSMMRNNPLQVLLTAFMPHPFGIGTPVTDNLFSKLFQGVLGYSFGPGMVLQGIRLNPWWNLVDG